MIRVVAWAALGLTVISWLALAARVLRYPENHVGYNVLLLIPLFLATVAAGLLHRSTVGRMDTLAWAALIGGALSILAIAAVYQFNILLPYETWLKRGMPPRPF